MVKASFGLVALTTLAACSAAPGPTHRPPERQRGQERLAGRVGDTGLPDRRGIAARQASLAPDASDRQWTIPAKNYASTRYSGLDQITAANVGRLQVAFTFSTGIARGHEAAPLVVGSTMYIVTPFPNTLYALDLRRPGAPAQVEVHAHADACGAGGGLLRRREPGRGLLGRPDLLQHARRTHRGGGCRNGAGSLEHEAGGDQSGREHHHGPAGGEGQGAGGKQWR